MLLVGKTQCCFGSRVIVGDPNEATGMSGTHGTSEPAESGGQSIEGDVPKIVRSRMASLVVKVVRG